MWALLSEVKHMQELEEKLNRTIESTKTKLSSIRTGRANPDLLSRILVDYYGSSVPLQQVANVSVIEGNTFVLNIFDQGAVQSVEKAILQSDLGLNPQTDGAVIRLRLPDLTEERRKELTKLVKQQCEEGKIALRNIRREYLDKIKQDNLSEDELKSQQDGAQKTIDKFTQQIDSLSSEKEQEILTI